MGWIDVFTKDKKYATVYGIPPKNHIADDLFVLEYLGPKAVEEEDKKALGLLYIKLNKGPDNLGI